MAAEQAEQKRREKFLEAEDVFRRNAFKITEMVILTLECIATIKKLTDELLHSILFLGKINSPSFAPEQIVPDEDMLRQLKATFPRPFDLFCSQLPRRSPMSCVLDMFVHLIGESQEEDIKQKLRELKDQLFRTRKVKHLISSTICVSQKTSDSVRYYGVSMSTSGGIPGQIIVAASCLSYWDDYVADAVMTYYHNGTKKNYFDGSIKLHQLPL